MEDYKKTIHQIITGAWQLFKAHLPVQEADSYWDDVVDGYTELSKRYTGTKYYNFAVSASMNCMDELARLYSKGGIGLTVKELKEELECYDEDAEVIFNFDDPSVEVESWTEDKYGYKTVSIDCNLKPTFIGEFRGDMRIELGKEGEE